MHEPMVALRRQHTCSAASPCLTFSRRSNRSITLKIPTAPASLPNDQVEDARRHLVGRLKPANSQAGFASYSSMNAAAIQALDEVAVLTSAAGREFAGSIYKQNGAFKVTPAQMGGVDWSSSAVAIPRSTQWVAIYHTHPDVNPNAGNFSPEDIMIGRGNGKGRPPLVLYFGNSQTTNEKAYAAGAAPRHRCRELRPTREARARALARTGGPTVLPNEQRWRAEENAPVTRPRRNRAFVETRRDESDGMAGAPRVGRSTDPGGHCPIVRSFSRSGHTGPAGSPLELTFERRRLLLRRFRRHLSPRYDQGRPRPAALARDAVCTCRGVRRRLSAGAPPAEDKPPSATTARAGDPTPSTAWSRHREKLPAASSIPTGFERP